VGGTWALLHNPLDTPDAALAAFYGSEPRPECLQAEPLRRAGQAVVPLVIAELPNRSMPRRRYALSFLGDGGYREALPALEVIARDMTELDYFRGDALLAISKIDLDFARRVAGELVDYTAHLGRIVHVLSQGGSALKAFNDRSCG
jgi:hypothetical protein